MANFKRTFKTILVFTDELGEMFAADVVVGVARFVTFQQIEKQVSMQESSLLHVDES
ncbi:MAG: hypothetical protein GXP29_00970 [Planctomycetes bacterium]|nr:hypothetical protein [Planctomycetota bacterium]